MATALRRDRITIAEYLQLDDRKETLSELVSGRLVAMATPHWRHNQIALAARDVIQRHIAPPCRTLDSTGVVVDAEDDSVLIPDMLMTCEELGDDPLVRQPSLVVEVLSPSNAAFDLGDKLALYIRLPSLREIWLLDGSRRHLIVWRRHAEAWFADRPYAGEASFTSGVLGTVVALGELYAGSGVAPSS